MLLVFPDGTGPALLSCLIGGIPLNRVHELQYSPGEVRLNVDYGSVNALASEMPTENYLDILERGRSGLKQLRENANAFKNEDDLIIEQEIEALEVERKRQLDEKRRELESKRKEKELAEEKNRQEMREERERKKRELDAKRMELRKTEEGLQTKEGGIDTSENSLDAGSLGRASAAVAGLTAVTAAVLGGSGDDKPNQVTVNEETQLGSSADDAQLRNSMQLPTDSEEEAAMSDEAEEMGVNGKKFIDKNTSRSSMHPPTESKDKVVLSRIATVVGAEAESSSKENAVVPDEVTISFDRAGKSIVNRTNSTDRTINDTELPSSTPLPNESKVDKLSSNGRTGDDDKSSLDDLYEGSTYLFPEDATKGTPGKAVEDAPNDGIEMDGMDYDDAWLGTISDIMNEPIGKED